MNFYVDFINKEEAETKKRFWWPFGSSKSQPEVYTQQFTINVSNGDYSDAFADGCCKLLEDFQREHPNIEYVSEVYFD